MIGVSGGRSNIPHSATTHTIPQWAKIQKIYIFRKAIHTVCLKVFLNFSEWSSPKEKFKKTLILAFKVIIQQLVHTLPIYRIVFPFLAYCAIACSSAVYLI